MRKTVFHIFNPETDYALALGRREYSAPKSIFKFCREMDSFPVLFAENGDVVVTRNDLPDSAFLIKYREIAIRDGIEIVAGCNGSLRNKIEETGIGNVEIRPWGWNHSLRRWLLKSGVPHCLLKNEEEIDIIRELAHRRTSIEFQKRFYNMIPDPDAKTQLAHEFPTTEEAIRFYEKNNKDVYFKLPWSSSGRGVLCTYGLNMDQVVKWLDGAIGRQGSVIGELSHKKVIDFASEWLSDGVAVEYLGMSLFRTSNGGRYGKNVVGSQNDIIAEISHFTSDFNAEFLEVQKCVLTSICSGRYVGPLGVDMLATTEGRTVPCIEINFRQTMGMAAIKQYQKYESIQKDCNNREWECW